MMMVASVDSPDTGELTASTRPVGPAVAERIAKDLVREFGRLSPDVVERCVTDVRACVEHLGMDATPVLVEKIVREHLVGMVKSEPPSGRLR